MPSSSFDAIREDVAEELASQTAGMSSLVATFSLVQALIPFDDDEAGSDPETRSVF